MASLTRTPQYSLGPVKPHVRRAAYYFGPKYGIRTIGGVAPRSTPSEHPEGLALDFMTTNVSVGDALSEDVIANARAFNVTYLIWNRRINSVDGEGWKPYNGASPHTDHVHVSFGRGNGTGNVVEAGLGGLPINPFDWLPEENAGEVIAKMTEFLAVVGLTSEKLKLLTDPNTWKRVLLILGGGFLILLSLFGFNRVKDAASTTVRSVKPNG